MKKVEKKIEFMKQAISLAASSGCVLPNPKVGAVIVHQNKIIAMGYHRGPGLPHAEVEVIRAAEKKNFKKFSESELFVSLEPCCHTNKRTPPCVPLLIEKKFKQVYVADLDPNPAVSGKGISLLKRAKIPVHVGLAQEEASQLNQAFIKNQQTRLPYVTLKMASTFDGKMADDFGESKWITNKDSRALVHELRSEVDAIAVGKNTVNIDKPRLNSRTKKKVLLKKVVVFGRPDSKNLKNIIAANGKENLIVLPSVSQATTKVFLKSLLRDLFEKKGICHLLIEGGPTVAGEFLDADLVDEVVHFLGKGYLLGPGRFSIGRARPLKRLKSSIKFTPNTIKLIGPKEAPDVLISGKLHVYRTHSKPRRN